MKHIWFLILFFLCFIKAPAQTDKFSETNQETANDSIKDAVFTQYIGNGYFPTKYFNFDLRYLVKYNQYEGFRTGLGGITNSAFSRSYRLQSYAVYGFLDEAFKYSFSGGFRISPESNTWIDLSYTDDLEETGSSLFLTDKRFFQFIEPRLFNIDLFHRHISKSLKIEHSISEKIITETLFSISKITPTYDYRFNPNSNDAFDSFDLSLLKLSAQWNPFNTPEYQDSYPNFTLQYSKSFSGLFNGDFNFSKLDFRIIQLFNHKNDALSEIVITSGIANGDIPLTHMYHTFPNNVNKNSILERFSVAGTNSFETMFFNEFFSDKFTTLRLKHKLKPFQISDRFKPQIALLTKFAIGNMKYPELHENISFKTLEKGYFESGIEINKLLFGLGLSLSYRYGAYHLPRFDDNVAFKFTFNLNLSN